MHPKPEQWDLVFPVSGLMLQFVFQSIFHPVQHRQRLKLVPLVLHFGVALCDRKEKVCDVTSCLHKLTSSHNLSSFVEKNEKK
mmetsp:Transcript_40414/g.65606  ORF Transcript_40414/g.65606 Transcript_40414/m.65606 type:complete len:83 (+) Transcript_40414:1458-1706(+)